MAMSGYTEQPRLFGRSSSEQADDSKRLRAYKSLISSEPFCGVDAYGLQNTARKSKA